MIFWLLTTFLLTGVSGIMLAYQIINHSSSNILFLLTCICIALVILISTISISTYYESRKFYNEFQRLSKTIQNIDAKDNFYECYYVSKVLNMNEQLYSYQDSLNKYNIFAAIDKRLEAISPIELETFDVHIGRLYN